MNSKRRLISCPNSNKELKYILISLLDTNAILKVSWIGKYDSVLWTEPVQLACFFWKSL